MQVSLDRKRRNRTNLALLLATVVAQGLAQQNPPATIAGVIKDPSDAIIQRAPVAIRTVETNQSYNTATDSARPYGNNKNPGSASSGAGSPEARLSGSAYQPGRARLI